MQKTEKKSSKKVRNGLHIHVGTRCPYAVFWRHSTGELMFNFKHPSKISTSKLFLLRVGAKSIARRETEV